MKEICPHIRIVRPNESHNGSIENKGAAAAYLLDLLRRQRAGAHAAQDSLGISIAQHLLLSLMAANFCSSLPICCMGCGYSECHLSR
jgi:hypothetical protein